MNRSVERVFLPKGVWYDFKTGKKYIGNKKYIVFYKDEDYPIFIKSGGVIPLANLGKNSNEINNPKSLEINVFPGVSNEYKLYEDDGITNDYKKGNFYITSLDYNYLQNNYTLIIHPIEGNYRLVPPKRDYKIRFRNSRKADDVTINLNGERIKDFTTYVDENDFVVEVKDIDVTRQLTINCKGKDIEINAVRIINEEVNAILSDLKIPTVFKEQIADIMFSDLEIKKKRIAIKRIKGLDKIFKKMFMKLLEYIAEI